MSEEEKNEPLRVQEDETERKDSRKRPRYDDAAKDRNDNDNHYNAEKTSVNDNGPPIGTDGEVCEKQPARKRRENPNDSNYPKTQYQQLVEKQLQKVGKIWLQEGPEHHKQSKRVLNRRLDAMDQSTLQTCMRINEPTEESSQQRSVVTAPRLCTDGTRRLLEQYDDLIGWTIFSHAPNASSLIQRQSFVIKETELRWWNRKRQRKKIRQAFGKVTVVLEHPGQRVGLELTDIEIGTPRRSVICVLRKTMDLPHTQELVPGMICTKFLSVAQLMQRIQNGPYPIPLLFEHPVASSGAKNLISQATGGEAIPARTSTALAIPGVPVNPKSKVNQPAKLGRKSKFLELPRHFDDNDEGRLLYTLILQDAHSFFFQKGGEEKGGWANLHPDNMSSFLRRRMDVYFDPKSPQGFLAAYQRPKYHKEFYSRVHATFIFYKTQLERSGTVTSFEENEIPDEDYFDDESRIIVQKQRHAWFQSRLHQLSKMPAHLKLTGQALLALQLPLEKSPEQTAEEMASAIRQVSNVGSCPSVADMPITAAYGGDRDTFQPSILRAIHKCLMKAQTDAAKEWAAVNPDEEESSLQHESASTPPNTRVTNSTVTLDVDSTGLVAMGMVLQNTVTALLMPLAIRYVNDHCRHEKPTMAGERRSELNDDWVLPPEEALLKLLEPSSPRSSASSDYLVTAQPAAFTLSGEEDSDDSGATANDDTAAISESQKTWLFAHRVPGEHSAPSIAHDAEIIELLTGKECLPSN